MAVDISNCDAIVSDSISYYVGLDIPYQNRFDITIHLDYSIKAIYENPLHHVFLQSQISIA